MISIVTIAPRGSRRRSRAARDRLGVLDPWLAQVHVDIDESRRDHHFVGRDDFRFRALDSRFDPRDPVAVDEHVACAVKPAGGIDDPAVPNQ